MFPREVLKQTFTYDSKNGGLITLRNTKAYKIGDVVGKLQKSGYITTYVGSQKVPVHRIIWTILMGDIPKGYEVDHIDGNPTNNKIENLRLVTHSQNMRNTKKYSHGSNRNMGVRYSKRDDLWYATIKVNQKDIYLGSFNDEATATNARKAAEAQYGFHPNHGRVAVER